MQPLACSFAMRVALPLLAALALAACQTRPQANVVRFHLGQPVPKSSVYVTAADPARANSLEANAYNQAVAAELQRLGFTVTQDRAQAEYLAVVGVSEAARPGQTRGSGVSVGLGGGFGSGNVGVGGSVRLPVGQGPQPTTVTATTLTVAITRQSDKTMIWEGRATNDPRRDTGGAAAAVPGLATALFHDFPGPTGQTVRVPLA
jgi:hypothetical protein